MTQFISREDLIEYAAARAFEAYAKETYASGLEGALYSWAAQTNETREAWRRVIRAAGHIPATVFKFPLDVDFNECTLDSARCYLDGPPMVACIVVGSAQIAGTARRLIKEKGFTFTFVEVPEEFLCKRSAWALCAPDGKVWSGGIW